MANDTPDLTERQPLQVTPSYTVNMTNGDLQRIHDEAAYINSVNRMTQASRPGYLALNVWELTLTDA